MVAASAGNTECVRYLLAQGADPNKKSIGVQTALLLGVQQRNAEIVEMLLVKGAEVNVREARGATPLILAAASDETGPVVLRSFLPWAPK